MSVIFFGTPYQIDVVELHASVQSARGKKVRKRTEESSSQRYQWMQDNA